MNVFWEMFFTEFAIIAGVVIVFQVFGKIFIKDYQTDYPEDEE